MAVSGQSSRVSDESILEATGRLPEEWFALLDAQGATSWTHSAIAQWLHGNASDIDGWWVQAITIRFEQARGMRQPGQKADGTFEVTASKAVGADPERARRVAIDLFSAEIGSPPASVTGTSRALSARWRLAGRESLLVTFTPTAAGKTTVAMAHSRLPEAQRMDAVKSGLTTSLAKLADVLG